VSFCFKTYLRARHERLVAAKLCISCEAPHDGKHVRCPDCHAAHLKDSRERYSYQPRENSGHLCSMCGNEGHNKRRCPVVRAA
jgi:hypothetical protein